MENVVLKANVDMLLDVCKPQIDQKVKEKVKELKKGLDKMFNAMFGYKEPEENKKSEIKSINKKIKQIRLSGLVEEKECVFRHLAEQKQFELDFAKYEYDHKCANSKIEKEYYQKIEDTKFDRSVIEFNFKKYNISSDNEVVHMFNENEKQSKLDHNAKVEDLYKLINERTLEQLAFEHEKADTEAEVTKNIYKNC